MALLNDPSYADYFGTDNVLAEKVSLINRVNQVYNDDLAVRFVLVDDTDKLNLDTKAAATGADGPCGAHPCFDPANGGTDGQLDYCSPSTIGRTRIVLGQLIGDSAYDVGHLVLGVNGGGIAYLGVAGADYSSGGCTGLPEPRGDFFAIDYVAHEMGHQFNGQHTFNGADGFCSGNGSRSSVEPGSGSSVMAYAGICGTDDLQPHTDPYFSQKTIQQATTYTSKAHDDVVEVQNVSLEGFDTDGDTLTLGYGGQTRTLTRGTDYTKSAVQKAVTDLVGRKVSIADWAFDPYLGQSDAGVGREGGPTDNGFQVIFASSTDPEVGGTHEDFDLLTAVGSDGVTATVGETAQGGPAVNGGAVTDTGNHAPTVKAPKKKTLPIRTPFRLKGSGSDADGDTLTYTWEQNDPGVGTGLVDNHKRFGPLFRVFGDNAQVSDTDALQSPSPGENIAGTSPVRWFPDLEQVVHGRTNAANGHCPRVKGNAVSDTKLDCYSEFLPTEEYRGAANVGKRTMHFRLTARDDNPAGGGVGHADVALKLKRSAGPFLITSHDDGKQLTGGKPTFVKWKVNGTRDLAKNVRIWLSTDNGATFDVKLANRTRNDGKKRVVLPEGTVSNAWIMVEARGNYFYDVSDKAFKIR